MSHHIVELKDLSFNYPDGTKGLDSVSFRISPGESVALVGENGAGKSTLLLHLNGCLLPKSGTVQIGDCILNNKNLKLIRRAVGMVFQNPDDQLFMTTVFDDVAFGLLNHAVPKQETETKVMEALRAVGADKLSQRSPDKLSQGEKRAVAIATVLALSPDILVMDEPSSNLDPKSRKRLITLLKSFPHTKIIATHDLDMALELCERTIVLHDGRIAADGPSPVIFRDEKLLELSNLEKPLSIFNCSRCGYSKF